MQRYEQFVRTHLGALYREARAVLGDEEEAAVAAQFLCLLAFRHQEEEEWLA